MGIEVSVIHKMAWNCFEIFQGCYPSSTATYNETHLFYFMFILGIDTISLQL